MNAPCGHKDATCVIGNFWACPVCDAPKPEEIRFTGETLTSVTQHATSARQKAKTISFTGCTWTGSADWSSAKMATEEPEPVFYGPSTLHIAYLVWKREEIINKVLTTYLLTKEELEGTD